MVLPHINSIIAKYFKFSQYTIKYLIMHLYFRFNFRSFFIYYFILRAHHSCTVLIRILLLTIRASLKYGLWITSQRQSSEVKPQVRAFALFLFSIIIKKYYFASEYTDYPFEFCHIFR